MSSVVERLIADLKKQQQEIAESAMMRPPTEPFHTGVMAGRYQGLSIALDTLNSILRDADEEERFS